MPFSAASGPASSAGPLLDRCPSDAQLLAYLPGQNIPAEASLSAHLEVCTACQSRLTTLRRVSQAPTGDPAPAPTLSPDERPTPAPVVDSQNRPIGKVYVAGGQGSFEPTMTLADVHLRVPQRIGQYELVRLIGRGGMGLVYEARHKRLGRAVAVKLLPGLHLSDRNAIVRMQRETAAAGRVQHPNIVFATDAGEQDGIDYLVMEYIEGFDVARLVGFLGPLAPADACEIIRQTALGLAHIHACGLVHRDLKPSNLMLAADGSVKILDLGLALLREGRLSDDESATQAGYLLGTADYVSPEQARDPHHADVRSDLYSLGCTFYKLLTGQAPFGDSEHESVSKKLDAHRNALPRPIRELRPDLPPEIESIMARLLAKRPDDRFQAPAELAAALAPLAVGANLPAVSHAVSQRCNLARTPFSDTSQQTPPPAEASTHPHGRTATPGAAVVRPRGWLWPALGVGAVLLLITSLVMMPARDKKTADAKPPSAPFPGLDSAPEEILLPGDAGLHDFKVHEDLQMIRAGSNTRQLIKLGELTPGDGSISLELHFPEDRGEAGLFFGYHKNVQRGTVVGESRFIYLDTLPRVVGNEGYRFEHKQAQLQPLNAVPVTIVGIGENVPAKPQRQFHLEVNFSRAGITAIKLDGKEYPRLLQPRTQQRFDSHDIWGIWGIYNNGSTIHVIKPTLKKGP
jgi:serine/threonine protein kinase